MSEPTVRIAKYYDGLAEDVLPSAIEAAVSMQVRGVIPKKGERILFDHSGETILAIVVSATHDVRSGEYTRTILSIVVMRYT